MVAQPLAELVLFGIIVVLTPFQEGNTDEIQT